MKEIFHLNIQTEKKDYNLYFEDKDTAENTVKFLTEYLVKEPSTKLKINATVHKVYSKETILEDFLFALDLVKMEGKN